MMVNNVSVGLCYVLIDWSSEIELGMDNYVCFEIVYVFFDQWFFSLMLEKNMFFWQVCVVEFGVMVDVVNINLCWWWDECFEIGGGYCFIDFVNNQCFEIYFIVIYSFYIDYDCCLSLGGCFVGQCNMYFEVVYFLLL